MFFSNKCAVVQVFIRKQQSSAFITNIWNMEVQLLKPQSRIGQIIHKSTHHLQQSSILIVGVGGIGCEVLKVLCKSQIGSIHILDMDTIQLSNLNRQFLFKQHHKGMSKSLVARESVLALNPQLKIQAHHLNIKQLPISFFQQFTFIVLALDNIEARSYVNKIAVRLNIPVVDAGTLAYKGNATTILAGRSRCYSCEPKNSSQKVFPVCTIRMRPEKPIHCIVWAKMLFQALFSADNEDNDLKDLAALAQLGDPQAVLKQLYETQILNIKNAKSDADDKLSQIFAKSIKTVPSDLIGQNATRKIIESYRLHDKVQSLQDSISAFAESFERLLKVKRQQGAVIFEKDDDDIIHFVTSAANLRMFCFGITVQPFNQVKNMAGNIVPAIASTNSIVSGIQIIEMVKYLRGCQDKMKSYFIQNQASKIMALKLERPLEQCSVCSEQALPVTIQCDFNSLTLGQLVELLQNQGYQLPQFSINQGSKEIYNSDDPRETLMAKTIFGICQAYQVDLVITDQEISRKICTIWLIHGPEFTQPIVKNNHLLESKPIPVPTKPQQQNGKTDSDSEVVCQAGESEQVEIVQVRKRLPPSAEKEEEGEQIRKRKKLQ